MEPSFRRVAHRLNVVAVGIEHEGAVIIRMIMRAKAGRAIIIAGRGQRFQVEGLGAFAIGNRKADVVRVLNPGF
jgi:hypothetical protein